MLYLYNIILFIVMSSVAYFAKKILSNEANFIKFQSFFLLYYFLTTFLSLLVTPFFLISPKNVKNAKITCQLLLKHITKLLGLRWELRNGKILSEERGAVIVSNHQSSLDILGQFNIWEVADKLTIISKKELLYWPFGLSAYLAGVVFINRGNPKQAYKQLQITTNVMVNEKTKIWFFPEGTRNKNPSKLLPFKKGAFLTAVGAQVPIIPVVFSPYYFINPDKYIFNKGRVIIKCLEPIETKGLTVKDIPDLMSRVYDLIQNEYTNLSKEVFETLPRDYAQINWTRSE